MISGWLKQGDIKKLRSLTTACEDDLNNSAGLSNVPVVKIDGVVDAIQQLEDAIMQLASSVVLDEGSAQILGQH